MSIPSGGPLPDHSPTGQTVRAKHMPQIYHSSPPTVLCALLFQIHCFVTLHVVMLTDQVCLKIDRIYVGNTQSEGTVLVSQ